ncbi:MAG TPA: carbon-nitrogen hydrolase family protein [Nitrospira sp.]|nr:carbon-nitrogen hydrolase family protein [Nitrospira sp.]
MIPPGRFLLEPSKTIMPQTSLRIAFLHLAPLPGQIAHNRRLIEAAVTTAAQAGATWILTPELAVCGYTFADQIGTDWIEPQPDAWMTRLCRLAAQCRLTLFLSHPERDRRTAQLHNSLFVITPEGIPAGAHRKINALRVGSESWSTPGTEATAVAAPPLERVGLLICADAYSPGIAGSLRRQGAGLLVSSAAWAPGFHGPNGEWERCTRDTGLPLLVCNRTGPDATMDFTKAESVVAKNGRRRLSMTAARSTIFLIEWNLGLQDLATSSYERIPL